MRQLAASSAARQLASSTGRQLVRQLVSSTGTAQLYSPINWYRATAIKLRTLTGTSGVKMPRHLAEIKPIHSASVIPKLLNLMAVDGRGYGRGYTPTLSSINRCRSGRFQQVSFPNFIPD